MEIPRHKKIFDFVVVVCRTISSPTSIHFVALVSHAGRVAVITGGNRGIGAKVVEKLIKCKISVVMGKVLLVPMRTSSKVGIRN